MAIDPEITRHKEWLGFLQPVGLVVSPPALVKAQAVVNRNVVDLQQSLLAAVDEDGLIADFPAFTVNVLGWAESDLVKPSPEYEIALPDYSEILAPTYIVPDPDSDKPQILVQIISPGTELDVVAPELTKSSSGWHASSQAKFERLLRETQIPIGLLCNGGLLRLVYAPRGESSGHLTFPVQAMCEVSGRLILGAMEMLLSAFRVFSATTGRSLKNLLEDSRKYQAEVSTTLANQVLDALWELLRGFQMADAAVDGKLLDEIAATDSQHIYGGLITTLMRLVFLLYAEDEGLMPPDDIYQRNYSVTGLYERLREDAGNYPDTMDQRYGAWAWLLSLFRLVYDGGGQTPEYLPARHGQLFDPDEYAFLEGRPRGSKFVRPATRAAMPPSGLANPEGVAGQAIEPPRIPDGVIYRLLEKLLILEGERLSYRSLDVEQIGSVYEGIMGFAVEQAESPSIGVYSKPKGSKVSTTVVVNVAAILAAKSGDRQKLLKELANCEVSGNALKELKAAQSLEDIAIALGRKVSRQTPNLLPVGSLYLQPGEERRRSGSHYTPRSLTKPIVETTLRPVLEGLGEKPTAEQILSLKVCDLAMGSGAFLVETCRQLAEKVVEAWEREENDTRQEISDRSASQRHPNQNATISNYGKEEPLLIARRLVAQRCLYGVDKNPFAVNLAKLSLWLVTLAKDLPFTFLDHALKCGDSLVGLRKEQIGSFGKDATYDLPLLAYLKEQLDRARSYRAEIQALDTRSDADDDQKRDYLYKVEQELYQARLTGDVRIAAFFEGSNKKQREERETEIAELVRKWRYHQADTESLEEIASRLRSGDKGIIPFNWDIEFPEVFDRENPGFDAIVGNPPFLGGTMISGATSKEYLDWITTQFPETGNRTDLVAYFFRRAFDLLRESGSLGLIATNTIAQGDTRYGGLRWICKNNGIIFEAQRRFKWFGQAAVIVSIINIFKGKISPPFYLDKKPVQQITAFLVHSGGHDNPSKLLEMSGKSTKGIELYGNGFLFADDDPDASPISLMNTLLSNNPKNQERIFPYLGGSEVNESPTHSHKRYVINFGSMEEHEAREWVELIEILEQKVKPSRLTKASDVAKAPWWLFWRPRNDFQASIHQLNNVLACSRHQPHWTLTMLPSRAIWSDALVIFAFSSMSAFAILQSRIHEIWARFFGSSMKDDLRYTPSDCFETFPFPENWETNPTLETVGKEYYEYRAALMVRNNQGLTDTYNRFHDPEERDPDILKLRSLHAAMDKAVLEAYGWSDIPTDCTFLLDYDDEEDEEETSNGRQRKKPWRYRWTEEVHDEVLARLLDLNQKRAQAEIIGGKAAQKKPKAKASKKKASKPRKIKEDAPIIPGLNLE
ncbi:N-6 DNA methylase [Nostoc linckia z18]|uniref:site-specific DNA-methyltransferase (adenine-specific) n=2 Tax=Nostoc linckia TaxID=92942 RepID=A0A9Q5Z9Z6_NOSLI|nr:DNA methyltransferase [Nostoc linckia]PHK39743.1 N-6 DNA methylase [Nostoc linckia z15]PHK44269.1 N-6 DNA methylase [Nostoc linckia z16]PHJ57236.1 N-6 DNA methylase [Nostoc linckia z1]PHJ59506.1 N-6 DNA methylase [Nostoc linckia z3]PHJ64095.1 N-6 DNA methylase [Nostoc linckia z2]